MPSWLRWVREAIALISDIWGFITFIAALASIVVGGVMYTRLGEEYLPPIIIGVLGIVGTAVCAYLAVKRRPATLLGAPPVPAYLRARRFAWAGLVLIPLLTVGGLAGWWYVRSLPPQKTIILVAKFYRQDTGQDNYGFTESLLERLHTTLAGKENVEIQSLKRAITVQDGSRVAEQEGKRRKATVVIWGWYSESQDGTTIRVCPHLEELREPKYMPSLEIKEPCMEKPRPKGFDFQEQFSREMTYLTIFIVGKAFYAQGECRDAERQFQEALRLAPNDVYTRITMGNAFYALGEKCDYAEFYYREAEREYEEALRLVPDDADVHYNLGVTYFRQNEIADAIKEFQEALHLNPDLAAAHYGLGVVYKQIGEKEKTVAELEEVLKLTTDERLKVEAEGYLQELRGK